MTRASCALRHAVTHACTDDYHRYDRKQRAELGITPLHPDCNYLDVMAQDLRHLRNGEAILKPVYRHADGTFAPPVYVEPTASRSSRACSATTRRRCATATTCASSSRPRGATAQVEGAARLLAARLHDRRGAGRARSPRARLAAFIRPQERYADMVVSFMPGAATRTLDAELILARRPAASGPLAVHRQRRARHDDERARPASASRATSRPSARPRSRRRSGTGCISPPTCAASAWASTRSGWTHRSESLALVQLLILYHLVTGRAAVALGREERLAG